jgi:hypothetical protein
MITKKHVVIVGLALGLPTTIIAASLGVWSLVESGYFDIYVGLGIILAVIFNTFYLIIRYAKKSSSN